MLLPHITPEQNQKLFPSATQPKQPIKAVAGQILAELTSLIGPVPDYGFEPTRTVLPELPHGPLKSAEKALEESWGDKVKTLEAMASQPPIDPPLSVQLNPGWTFYPVAGYPVRVKYPSEDVLIFDVETYVQGGNHPVMAAAASLKGWYVWLSTAIVSGESNAPHDKELIPLGPPKLIVAHNALFDLSKVVEQYSLAGECRHVAFCTMAAHGTVASVGGEQVKRASMAAAVNRGPSAPWQQVTTSNGLAACLELYTGQRVDKEARSAFLGSWEGIYSQREALIKYNLDDVAANWLLLIPLWTEYRLHNPSLVNLAGMFEASRTMLPLSEDYHLKVFQNDAHLESEQRRLEKSLVSLAKDTLKQWQDGEIDPTTEPWLSQLDWSVAKTGKNKGLPKWYREVQTKGLTLGSRMAPLLTRTTWQGKPLHYDKSKKWGYIDDHGQFNRLPHPDGKNANVGSPYSKHFARYAEDGVLSSTLNFNIPQLIASLGYWVSFSSRFKEVYTRKLSGTLGVVPVTNLKGTLTGRQSHKLWLTMAQTKPGRLGTDLSHAIQAPEGYRIVSWDEDTEEVRIAALWGDLREGWGLGTTAMSQVAFMGVNTGDLATATDAHSVTAKVAGISRQDAKTANFRDIFGGGVKTQSDALASQHPDWPDSKIAATVTAIMTAKRGHKSGGVYRGGTDSAYHNQAGQIADMVDFRLPATGRLIPRVINPRYDTLRQFYTSRYNFPVQGTGADILDATNALVPIVAKSAGIPDYAYGHVFDRHDEFVYLVKEEYADQFAEVANSVHCWAWAIVLEGMGFDWMPTPLARLSGINVDTCYRKEPNYKLDAGFGFGFNNADGYVVR